MSINNVKHISSFMIVFIKCYYILFIVLKQNVFNFKMKLDVHFRTYSRITDIVYTIVLFRSNHYVNNTLTSLLTLVWSFAAALLVCSFRTILQMIESLKNTFSSMDG